MSDVKLDSVSGMSDEEKIALANAMLDASFDDIQETASFRDLPAGVHSVQSVTKATVDVNAETGAVAVKVICTMERPLELAAYPGLPEDQWPDTEKYPEGTLTSFRFSGPFGIQQFRTAFATVYNDRASGLSVRDFVTFLNDDQAGQFTVTTKLRRGKEANGQDANGNPTYPYFQELVTTAL